MKKYVITAAVVTIGLASVPLIHFRVAAQEPSRLAMTADVRSAQALTAEKLKGSGYPDFGFMISAKEYRDKYPHEPIFRLKADFPTSLPRKLPDFLEKIDFMKQPLEYINAVRDYSFEGNIPDWDPYHNKVREWYHIPWLHPTAANGGYPPNGGTEGFHGLIKEAGIKPLQLGPGQKGQPGDYSVYAITLINDFAGYTMGKMWADPDHPDPRATDRRFGGGFPVGTVFAKLLFTDAPKGTDKIAYLVNPLQWTAFITPDFEKTATRSVGKVNLLQMDIAVRDARADVPGLTGWVFGTFVYNGTLNNPNKFMNMVPAGLMWGNDPEDKTNTTTPFPPTKTMVNPNLRQGVIFNTKDLPPQHLGWNGRLNGPADLNTTSCMSCHIAAQYPQISPLVPDGATPDGGLKPPATGGSPEWMKSFANIRCATSMDERAYSTDFSFQVAIALQNFFDVKGPLLQGAWATDYSVPRRPIVRHPLTQLDMTRVK
jgi:hypothetical protein